jgi:hypothetical protein
MEQSVLMEIIERTFSKLSCPMENNGVYAEIRNAILEAYRLGQVRQNEYESALPPLTEPR